MSLPIGSSEFVIEGVDIKSPISEATSTSFFTSVLGVFFPRSCQQGHRELHGPSASFHQIIPVGEEGHCADRTNREVLRNVRHQFLRILARLLLSIAFDRNLPQSALANLFGLLEQSNNVGSSTSTSELDRKLVVRDRMLSQPTHICSFLAMLSSTSRHETPLSSGHGRDVTSGAVCENCFYTRAVVTGQECSEMSVWNL